MTARTSTRTRSLPVSIAACSMTWSAPTCVRIAAISDRSAAARSSPASRACWICRATPFSISSADGSDASSPGRSRSIAPVSTVARTPPPTEDRTPIPAAAMAPAPTASSGQNALAHSSEIKTGGETLRSAPSCAARCTQSRMPSCIRRISSAAPPRVSTQIVYVQVWQIKSRRRRRVAVKRPVVCQGRLPTQPNSSPGAVLRT